MGESTDDGFWNAVNIWVKKAHVVNKRLWGTAIIAERKICCSTSSELLNILHTTLKSSHLENLLSAGSIEHIIQQDFDACNEVIITKLFPKLYSESVTYQVNIFSKHLRKSLFISINNANASNSNISPSFPYMLCVLNGKIILECFGADEKGKKWLEYTVLPQVIKWSTETKEIVHGIESSLCMVSVEKYYHKYNELKEKYGKELVKIWPECTDPSKFVYEDIAIATYLILLWDDRREAGDSSKLQSFVDLGCGNGLLVYILSSEGHPGYGIDVRRRKIWSVYPNHVVLKEVTITPSDEHLFPEMDWIIGNHSDELTPWIPVITTLSSYNSSFFVLPCCSYNFNGTKYQRKDSSKSLYNDYIDYVVALCRICGFVPKMDRLKIPSTKRICIIGDKRIHPLDEYENVCNDVRDLILTNKNEAKNVWLDDFKPRLAEEKVKNCTKISRNIIDEIIEIICTHLLKDYNNLNPKWFEGTETELKSLIEIVPDELLKCLKSECGGLQTLLRNNHSIFKVENGKVKFRHPKTVEELKSKKAKLRRKECWFYRNHPQGCPLEDSLCTYKH